MKVIDLLNKIAEGEEFNNCKIKYKGIEPEEVSEYFIYDILYEEDLKLNDEVEIIEEDKEIKKLEVYQQITANGNEHNYINYNGSKYAISTSQRIIENQNKLIDEVNKLKGSNNNE